MTIASRTAYFSSLVRSRSRDGIGAVSAKCELRGTVINELVEAQGQVDALIGYPTGYHDDF